MKWFMLCLLATGCTINVQIDTDYASQNKSDGEIQEQVTTEAVQTNTPTVDTAIDANGI